MQIVQCEFIELRKIEDEYGAVVRRTTAHPLLGPPNGKTTLTSKVRFISFEQGFLLTQNTMYVFGDMYGKKN